MKQHRSILACLACLPWLLALGVALSAGGCASGGGDTATTTDDGGGSVTDATAVDGSGDGAACTGGKIKCGTTCTNPTNDPKNCGKCGNACVSGQVCSMGTCGLSCGAGQTLCGGGPAEAGAPEAGGGTEAGGTEAGGGGEAGGGASDAGDAAVDSGSAAVDSGSGTADAGGTAPYCANTNSDPNNCGGCGMSCGPNGTCMNGTCGGITCPGGQKACFANGSCIPNNSCCQSGECTISGEVCPMPGGTCQCPAGETECSANMQCISTSTCCTTADCNKNGVTGQTCATPGQQCACSKTGAGQCCQPSDCTSANVGMYTCSGTNACGIGTCKTGCYDLNNKYSDGCECCADTNGHACASPTNGGALAIGMNLSYPGNIPTPTGEDWFTVTFNSETNTAFHALISLTTNPNSEFVFDVLTGGCGGTAIGCGEGGTCSGKTTFEESYAGPSPAADPNSKTPAGVSNFTAIAAIGQVWIRVHRASTSAAATCDSYTLSISE